MDIDMKQQMEKQSMSKKKIKELENNFSKHFECSITYKKKIESVEH